jgi:hypothetical protein
MRESLGDERPDEQRPDGNPLDRTGEDQLYRALDRFWHAVAYSADITDPEGRLRGLGDASVAFTMDRYQHVMPTMQAQAADAIQAALGPR